MLAGPRMENLMFAQGEDGDDEDDGGLEFVNEEMQRYSDCSGVTMKGITRRCTMLKISNRSENKYFHTSSHRLTHTTTKSFQM